MAARDAEDGSRHSRLLFLAPGRLPAQPPLLERIEIGSPDVLLLGADAVEPIPCVEAGVVAVIEADANGVGSDGLDALDTDILLAGDDGFLRRAVTLNFRRRALDAQQLRWQTELRPSLKSISSSFASRLHRISTG